MENVENTESFVTKYARGDFTTVKDVALVIDPADLARTITYSISETIVDGQIKWSYTPHTHSSIAGEKNPQVWLTRKEGESDDELRERLRVRFFSLVRDYRREHPIK
jgi:hypothetical protein